MGLLVLDTIPDCLCLSISSHAGYLSPPHLAPLVLCVKPHGAKSLPLPGSPCPAKLKLKQCLYLEIAHPACEERSQTKSCGSRFSYLLFFYLIPKFQWFSWLWFDWFLKRQEPNNLWESTWDNLCWCSRWTLYKEKWSQEDLWDLGRCQGFCCVVWFVTDIWFGFFLHALSF